MWAARQGHEGVVRLLLAHPGILVNLVNNEGHSALMWAATNGHEGVVKLLLAHSGTLVNLTSHEGWSALMLAASTGRDIIVKLLLASPGIEANLVNSDRWSPLMAAAREGHKGLVALLLAHRGIQANLVSNHGSTALLLSAERGHAAVVKLLLDVGVSMSMHLTKTGTLRSRWQPKKGTKPLFTRVIFRKDDAGGRSLHDLHSPRVTAFVPSARDLQIGHIGDLAVNTQFPQRVPGYVSKATLGTGMWLVKGDKFRLWLEPNGDIKIFWGSGIPGAGKTLLASIVIEHLETLCQNQTSQSVFATSSSATASAQMSQFATSSRF
ncbi:ankyrin repeat-containing domain protein [Coprinopsis sp. MPI-PUGE-AT-0042]|nr:ankyrin repeat-containing domain protein [Coprinopsis sp. MPI-PUGE-AT-0042]